MSLSVVKNAQSSSALKEVKQSVKNFVGRTHPAALVAWFLVGFILLAGLVFTGYHNWNLFARGATTDAGQILAAVPPLLLDGSIGILCVLLLTYFKDPLQWWVAVIFNLILFVIVGVNTSLDYSLSTGEEISEGLRVYLRWGILGTFLFAFAIWEVIIHLDPVHKRKKAKAALELQAEEDVHQIELELIELEIAAQRNELDYEKTLQERMHAARMKAAQSTEVEGALTDFEKGEAVQKAKRIRGTLPKA